MFMNLRYCLSLPCPAHVNLYSLTAVLQGEEGGDEDEAGEDEDDEGDEVAGKAGPDNVGLHILPEMISFL